MKRSFLPFSLFMLLMSPSAWANPSGGAIASGSGTITYNGGTLTINQTSNTAIINWKDFSNSYGETIRFTQPTATSAILNRVTGTGVSTINGNLMANGAVYLINQNGVVIGANGLINTAGFTASTRDIANSDFASGHFHFVGSQNGTIQNFGKIAASTGNVVLIGKTVDNEGTIQATAGTAGLVSADDVLLGQANADGSTITVKATATAASSQGTAVTNKGSINAFLPQLKVANGNLFALAIQDSGTIHANAYVKNAGRIYLTSDAGTVNSGALTSDPFASITAGYVTLVGGKAMIAGGTVNFNGPVNVPNGYVILNSAGNINVGLNGNITAGTYILQRGNWLEELGQNGLTSLPLFKVSDFQIFGGTFLRTLGGDGTTANPFQITDVYGLEGVKTYLSSNFILANDINAGGTGIWSQATGFHPIGNTLTPFTGTFNGAGFTISNLYINRPTQQFQALFGCTGASALVENLGLINLKIKGNTYVGGLVADNLGTISSCFASGTVLGNYGSSYAGGLVGYSSNTILDCSSTANVTGYSYAGGLAGYNYGLVQNSYATGSVSGNTGVGGLLGAANGKTAQVLNSYATGTVTGATVSYDVAGLIGVSGTGVLIKNCYATGAVKGAYNVGGLIGYDILSSVQNCYWLKDGTLNASLFGIGNSVALSKATNLGAASETLAQLQTASTYATTWDFTPTTGVWTISSGINNGLPALQSNP